MKRKWIFGPFLCCVAWLNFGAPLGIDAPAWAGGQVCVDGDVNQDGAVNITDPVHLLGFLFQGGPPPVTCSATATKPVSVVFVTRHAEKAAAPADDPPLTAEGMERAARLADVFKNATVHHLIASTKLRTQQTLEPLATAKGIKPEDVQKIGDLDTASAKDVVDAVKKLPAGDVTVICHHSTTIEPILIELGIPKADAATIDTNAFDNIVEVLLPSGGPSQMVKLTYK